MREIDKVAWILLEDGRVLSTRSSGKDVWYLPGGKREPGETDLETLHREIDEELSVEVDVRGAEHLGTFTAQAHGHASDVTVRMTCYRAGYRGQLRPASEIAEMAWLGYADRHRTSPVDQLIFDHLRSADLLR
ncbi:NUDIX hydrolase [Micromonospora parathelypteridis]|uniref:8-oxo-dGTP pyrophosphatase MutT (NUDIX family) n=1 Tax=Micromonospora parathelypteridis TaxID=1839617 RepID=A0A840W7X3_9ACTN|nr:NUDIX domain-containing protein [Micromonospora parathelypteridis]MBB5481128.1 8-oxo-dGTP pyrophosphatase MutT (NUDIX family) [Micromonospora parathelypteridis]GGO19944.1 DNA mismatch repair protein MutT [Micromonospora parathelypteridis]